MGPSHFLEDQTPGFLELSLVLLEVRAAGEETNEVIDQKFLLLIGLGRDELIDVSFPHFLEDYQFPQSIPHLVLQPY